MTAETPSPDAGAAAAASELARVFTAQRERLRRIVLLRLDARLRARVDADDVLQEGFLAANKRLPHYRSDLASMFVWVRMVVLQTIVDVARRHFGARRGSGSEVSLNGTASADSTSQALLGQMIARTTSPTRAVVRAENAERLTAAIAEMSPTDREILMLRLVEELDHAEAAAVLGIKKPAATLRYLRALARLQTRLRAGEEDAP